jgi:hypothetical protein
MDRRTRVDPAHCKEPAAYQKDLSLLFPSFRRTFLSVKALSVGIAMETVVTRTLVNIAGMLAFVLLVVLMGRLL